MNLKSIIESLLYITDRPIIKKEIARITKKTLEEVEKAIDELIEDYQKEERGIVILTKEDELQMTTSPQNTKFVKKFLDKEIKEELTPAAIETLSIISYRGPIVKEKLDQIRGVNCAVILRHLMIKGLIDEIKENGKTLYNLSFDFLRYLGIKNQKELPDYEKFHNLEINFSKETHLTNPGNNSLI